MLARTGGAVSLADACAEGYEWRGANIRTRALSASTDQSPTP